MVVCVFFCKQKTAYEMRISDWSSDVCSSDLNKGAALTTYLSLAGRYCVLMPNTTHGGGISRKISNQADRKRLKQIMTDLQLPPSMGCIVRTAGLERTKTEIKRDFDYLTRLWDEIRDNTLRSSAPALIHEDSNLIKREIGRAHV